MSNKKQVGATNLPGLKRSVRKVTLATRKASQSDSGASPTLRGKRKRMPSQTDEDAPCTKRPANTNDQVLAAIATLQRSVTGMGKRLDDLPNKDYMDKVNDQICNNREKIEELGKLVEDGRANFVRDVERIVDGRVSSMRSERHGILEMTAVQEE